MAKFMTYQPFEQRGGKIYFRRGRSGPVYEVSEKEKAALVKAAGALRRQMTILIGAFFMVFAVTILLLPQIIDLNYGMALMVIAGLLFVSILPFFLLVKFHLIHQKKIRHILGTRKALLPENTKAREPRKTSPERLGVNTNRLILIFLLGVAITTVGVVMLFSGEEMPFRKQLIWWMNLITGSMLTGLGLYGLLRKKPKAPNPPGFSRDDQSGRR
ncbi:MAG: hypothetical protein IID52_05115 [Proteobacteria bacterium]|nr:hypothetical protein [Pseudomonadota bacterium]